MRMLAKFVGFVISRPFAYDTNNRNTTVDDRQIQLRNTLLPTFDIKSIILKAITEKKQIVIIPWVVQYLSMLDYVTLRLNYYKDVFCILFKLYVENSILETNFLKYFIVKFCLGWLFEQSTLSECYFNYRQQHCSVEMIKHSLKAVNNGLEKEIFNPMYEALVVAACPFLSEFRVSIMPPRVEKHPSRTGKYRHITTMLTSTKKEELDVKKKLTEAFLQTQSPSVRRIVDFVIERVTSAAVKDFQYNFLFKIKKEVAEQIKEITSIDEVLLLIFLLIRPMKFFLLYLP